MYYSMIGLLAILVLLVENQDVLFTLRKGFDTPTWKAYRRFLFAILVYYATDITWGILESNKLAGPLFHRHPAHQLFRQFSGLLPVHNPPFRHSIHRQAVAGWVLVLASKILRNRLSNSNIKQLYWFCNCFLPNLPYFFAIYHFSMFVYF